MKKTIVYIDDEFFLPKMESKIDIIKEIGVEIVGIDSVELALRTIERLPKVDLVILDIIMPSGDLYSLEETNGGTTTGLRLLEDIRKKNTEIPIMLISIKRKANLDRIDSIIRDFKVSAFIEKQATSATEISNEIKKILNL